MASSPDSKRKLMDAAEALVKAAVSETEATAVSHGRATVASLESISKSVSELHVSNDGKLNLILPLLAEMVISLKGMNSKMEQQVNILQEEAKRRKIEFALQHTERQNFDYRQDSGYNNKSNSLVTDILWSFLKGNGYYLPSGARSTSRNTCESTPENFRAALISQLENLLGSKPRITDAADGRQIIWYE
mmetsp:Transcript_4142/g.8894  ORF Transcript_4142/g.8894 Transcript_4142/m.8894 type:complete len:190 (+) Transcript_4142:38-607(+)